MNKTKVANAAKNGIAKLKDVKERQKAKFKAIKEVQKQKIKNIKPPKKIPTYLTLLNLVCGFLAITFAISGKFDISVLLIITGFIFDMLDGLVARAFNITSQIGVELDSLADAVTFVLTPALIVYLKLFSTPKIAIIVSIFIVVFGIYRLAKFNITKPADYFTGLPTPFFAAIVIFLAFVEINIKESILALMIITFAYLMVSPIRYPNFKNPVLKKYRYFGIIMFLVLIIGLILNLENMAFGITLHLLVWIFFGIMLLIDKNVKRKREIILFDIGLILLTIAFYDNLSMFLFLPFIYGIIASPLIERSFRDKMPDKKEDNDE